MNWPNWNCESLVLGWRFCLRPCTRRNRHSGNLHDVLREFVNSIMKNVFMTMTTGQRVEFVRVMWIPNSQVSRPKFVEAPRWFRVPTRVLARIDSLCQVIQRIQLLKCNNETWPFTPAADVTSTIAMSALLVSTAKNTKKDSNQASSQDQCKVWLRSAWQKFFQHGRARERESTKPKAKLLWNSAEAFAYHRIRPNSLGNRS